MDTFEVAVLESLKGMLKTVGSQGKQQILQELHALLTMGFGKQLLGLEEIMIWARARSQQREMIRVASEVLAAEPEK